MPEYEFVNDVELSPLKLAECKSRVMCDLDERRTSSALAGGLHALYGAAIDYPLTRAAADTLLRRLAIPLAERPSSIEWTPLKGASRA